MLVKFVYNEYVLTKDLVYIFSEKSTTLAADTDLPDVAVLSDLSDLWAHLNSEHDWDVKTPDTGLAELGRGCKGPIDLLPDFDTIRSKTGRDLSKVHISCAVRYL